MVQSLKLRFSKIGKRGVLIRFVDGEKISMLMRGGTFIGVKDTFFSMRKRSK